ncbi:TBCC-domain-containing protein [Westerdykella ornata]|uniref:TBCC-domain-containing protein n=1 Tax=Westerdykella ornata TaxID=318751 RepID=A0A6A6JRN9_WESOR|nr:TBCC-domain-containing protein [Westerdykella ornata]KAF2278386.1 TBCC-domain-containing protein [Westerdykella ornata]
MENATTNASAESEATLKERFYRQFQNEVNALEKQIEGLGTNALTGADRNASIENCLAGIDRLSHEVKDASSYLPAYDRRAYSNSIKTLSDKLERSRKEAEPPKKFRFKSARIAQAATSTVPRSAAEESQSTVESSSQQTPTSQPTFKEEQSATIFHRNNAYITLPTTSGNSSRTIANITNSIILPPLSEPQTVASPLASLILKDISTSLIILPQIDGPIHMTNITSSILVASCRQFRMHASRDVQVYLHCGSRPIIEDCEGVRFAPLPECFTTPEMRTRLNRWDQIDDFGWLKAEPSPHFSVLGEHERFPEQAWRDVAERKVEKTVEDALKAFGILKDS